MKHYHVIIHSAKHGLLPYKEAVLARHTTEAQNKVLANLGITRDECENISGHSCNNGGLVKIVFNANNNHTIKEILQ